MKQAPALKKALTAMKLRPEHGALRAYCIGLAEVIDEYPERATLWREYRPALETLLAVGEVATDDGQAALLRLVSTPVGDAPQAGEGDVGAGGGGTGAIAGPTADAVAGAGRKRRPRAAS